MVKISVSRLLQEVGDKKTKKRKERKETIPAYQTLSMVVTAVWTISYMDLGQGVGSSKKEEQY